MLKLWATELPNARYILDINKYIFITKKINKKKKKWLPSLIGDEAMMYKCKATGNIHRTTTK